MVSVSALSQFVKTVAFCKKILAIFKKTVAFCNKLLSHFVIK